MNNKKNYLVLFLCTILITGCVHKNSELKITSSDQDLVFNKLASTWDEGIPLGNAVVGSLVWQNGENLRFSLDRTDLWDLRPMDSISGPNNRFSWVKEQVNKKDYLPVQKKYDWPYEASPAPSKIPGAALEFSLAKIGTPNNVRLYLNNALCEVKWENGTSMQTFVHAEAPVGWFIFRNLKETVDFKLIAPRYSKAQEEGNIENIEAWDLRRLGYTQGEVKTEGNTIHYQQKGWGDYYYDVAVKWEQDGETLYGTWSVTSSMTEDKAQDIVESALTRGLNQDYSDHMTYWNTYWAQSSVTLPDPVLQKQYDNEMYKFGSASREHSYPISLQSVWTADNGHLPPWKGDYHHDLNTQLSYWPAYTGNHLSEGLGYLNTLWNQRETYKKYTKTYFEVEGLNIPGVCTLTGEPMGGWAQYSMSPTVSSWLSHHFYMHWKYSGDRLFLKERAYPFIKDVAIFLENMTELDVNGTRSLPLSSSPEMFDNSIKAWFKDMTNFDLALTHFVFMAASELATELNNEEEAKHWLTLKKQLADFDLDKDGAMTIAKGYPFEGSHRHLSNLVAIHPLGIIDWADGERSQKIIKASLDKVEAQGSDYWTGYTYSWFALMKARALDGESAAKYLQDFANHFCLINTFHVNGDQTKSGKSKFTYRPFTLEGNFAFASGVQEMLLQSHAGYINVFPAIPATWSNVSFDKLRAMGAFLVSVNKEDNKITDLEILSEQGNLLKLLSPFDGDVILVDGKEIKVPSNKMIEIQTMKGQKLNIRSK